MQTLHMWLKKIYSYKMCITNQIRIKYVKRIKYQSHFLFLVFYIIM